MSDLATVARDEGIADILHANKKWAQTCLHKAHSYRLDAVSHGQKATFTGETLRVVLLKDVGEPNHHNAWGGLINTLVRKKIIRRTGKFVHMRMPRSHARLTPEYTWTKL
jgi:hypothetical protein